eukprot:475331_1
MSTKNHGNKNRKKKDKEKCSYNDDQLTHRKSANRKLIHPSILQDSENNEDSENNIKRCRNKKPVKPNRRPSDSSSSSHRSNLSPSPSPSESESPTINIHRNAATLTELKAIRIGRSFVLVVVCISMLSYSYCYDNPAALQQELQSKYNLTNIEYNLLYSAYTFPNFILPLFSGILTDFYGVDIMILTFFIFIVIGHGVFISGCIIYYYYLMLIGRVLFGIGCESFSLCVTALVYEYFNNKELSLALGLLLSLSRVGSSLNDFFTYYIYINTNNNIILSISVGFILLIFCLLLIIIMLLYRYKARKKHAHEQVKLYTHAHLKRTESVVQVSCVYIKHFDLLYWIIVLICGLIYSAVLSFMNIGNDFLQTHYHFNHHQSNLLLMIPYMIAAVFTPFIGYYSDKIGRRSYMLLVSTIILMLSHFIFLVTDESYQCLSIIGLCGLGIAYSIFCAVIWPSIGFIIQDSLIGTGYAIPIVFYNILLTVFYLLVGALTRNSDTPNLNKYKNVEICLFSLSSFATVCVLLLIFVDKGSGSKLNAPVMRSVTISPVLFNYLKKKKIY